MDARYLLDVKRGGGGYTMHATQLTHSYLIQKSNEHKEKQLRRNTDTYRLGVAVKSVWRC